MTWAEHVGALSQLKLTLFICLFRSVLSILIVIKSVFLMYCMTYMRFYVVFCALDGLNFCRYLSIMIDNDLPRAASDNIRSLVYQLGTELDLRIAAFRSGTPYEHVRASDVRVFIFAAAGNSSISDVARHLGISRQAVHMSAQRLKELGVIEFGHAEPSRRDVQVTLTAQGREALEMANHQIRLLEAEITEVIGADGLQTFRRTLQVLVNHARHKTSLNNGRNNSVGTSLPASVKPARRQPSKPLG